MSSVLSVVHLASTADSDTLRKMDDEDDDFESPLDPILLGSLKSTVLIADPRLSEPTFRRSVLLLTEHSEELGAHGYILNRPLGQTVAELMPDPEFEILHDVPVFVGGPVSTEHLTFSSLAWSEMDDALQFSTHLSAKEALGHQAEGYAIRAFVGYSGWTGGQLESEIAEKTWIVQPASREVIEMEKIDSLWRRLLREVSPWHRLLADEPDDLRLN